jgi:hypothetical protein
MEILRVPPYSIVANITAEPDTEYEVSILDMVDLSVTTETIDSDDDGLLLVELPSDRDGEYTITFGEDEEVVNVVRPYVDPNTKATTASEIAEYAKNERLVRAIIDSIIPEGFYYKKHVMQTTGLGSDYIPLWVNANKIFAVTENNTVVYDSETPDSYLRSFEITKDKTAIVETYSGDLNRFEGAPLVIPFAASDSSDLDYTYRGFPKTYDYEFVLGVGYKRLPSDIVLAAEMLIDDLACGRLEYFKRYISTYDTEQFVVKLDDRRAFDGTGNILVDKVLSKYAKSIRTVGVL